MFKLGSFLSLIAISTFLVLQSCNQDSSAIEVKEVDHLTLLQDQGFEAFAFTSNESQVIIVGSDDEANSVLRNAVSRTYGTKGLNSKIGDEYAVVCYDNVYSGGKDCFGVKNSSCEEIGNKCSKNCSCRDIVLK